MLGQFGSFAMIVVSLVAMLTSSLQIRFWLRVFALALAAASLCTAAWLAMNAPRPHLFEALIDDWQIVWGTFQANSQRVESAFAPVLDLAMVIAIVMFILTAFALTPGQKTERLIRPIKKVILGACLGCILTLAIVGVGFGAQSSPHAYVGYLSADDITDADTFGLGDTKLRLWGIDALELDQKCLDGEGNEFSCGLEARSALVELVAGELVHCFAPNRSCSDFPERESSKLGSSFGRPIVTCTLPNRGTLDLARQIASRGFATTYERDPRAEACYGPVVESAKEAGSGMWQGWTLTPRDWRNIPNCRAWTQSPTIQTEAPSRIIDCNVLPAANDN